MTGRGHVSSPNRPVGLPGFNMHEPHLFAPVLLDAISDGVLAFDRECRYTLWNAVMERISGLPAAEVIGKHAFTLFPFLVETGESVYFEQALRGETVSSHHRPFTVPSTGKRGFFEGHYRPLRDRDDNIVGGLGVIRDVTAEQQLKEREESLHLHYRVLQSMREGVSVSDEDGVILYTNPAEDAMFGYAPGELCGQHVTAQNAYPPEENARRVAAVMETLRREGIWVGEWLNRRKDGTTFTTRAKITAFETNGKRLWVCVQDDVTQEKAAEQALKRRSDELRLALEASRMGPWQWDAATDVVTFSEAAARIFGIPPGPQMTWTAMRELLHPDDREHARTAVEAAIAQHGDYDIEYRVNRPGGESCWVSAKGRATYDAQGKVRGMLGVVQDVTERKRAEQALIDETRAVETINRVGQLLAAELDLRNLLQALTDAATEISDAQFGSFFYNAVNERGEYYMLYTLSGASRDAFKDFPMPRNTEIFGRTFRGEGVVRLDDVTKDPRYGKSAPYYGMPPGHLPVRSYLAVPVLSRTGKVLGGLFVGHERPAVFTSRHERLVTGIAAQAAIALDNARLYQQARDAEKEARQHAAQLSEADRRKDDFLAVLAHELRNPLGAISNALHVMGATPSDSPKHVRAREVALRQVLQQQRLVDDLLDVSRIARGKIQLQLDFLDFARVVREATADHQLALETAGLTLLMEIPDERLVVRGDRARLTQIIGNLLDNARKFTPRGGTVRVRVERANGNVVLVVRDSGVGIEPDTLPLLFSPFAQAERTLDRSQGGLGLGLALVRGFVELHPGGRVEVLSEGPDTGTEFKVSLTLEERPAPSDEPASASPHRGLRVLVVEDIQDVADTMAELLELLGCQSRVAYSGLQGLEAAREFRPDVIFCDIGLPHGITGYDFAQELRADPATAATRLIALSGYGTEADRHRSRESGFDLHLTKPVQPDQLLKALHEVSLRSGDQRDS